MSSLVADILASAPIAYWPLFNAADVSGNGHDFSIVGSPSFNNNPLNADLRTSYLSGPGSAANMVRIQQTLLPSVVSLEAFFKLYDIAQTNEFNIIGLNIPITGTDNSLRNFLFFSSNFGYGGLTSFRSDVNNVATWHSTPTHPFAELTALAHHLVMQYDAQEGNTLFYIDGVLDPNLTQVGNMFDTTADRYLIPGVRYNSGLVVSNCYVSDVAVYSRKLTAEEISARQAYTAIRSANFSRLEASTLLWANQETREQAWPGEISIKETLSQIPEKMFPITSVSALNAPLQRSDLGFISGIITRKSVPTEGNHVICLDARFNLVAETTSGDGGYYRFDNLPINQLYTIHAYDNEIYQYAPVGADRRTPEAYP